MSTTSTPTPRQPRRLLRILCWSLVTFVTSIGLLHAWLSWVGGRALERSMKSVAAAGESLDFKTLILPRIDPAQNFCAIPPLDGITAIIDGDSAKGPPGANRRALMAMKLEAKTTKAPQPRRSHGPSLGQAESLSEWTAWLRKTQALPLPATASNQDALDLRQTIETTHPLLKTLAQAATERPAAQFTPGLEAQSLPSNLFSITLPHYQCALQAVNLLELHALAAIESGDSQAALADIQAIQRFAVACAREPFLIGLLVSASCQSRAFSAIWLGLKNQAFSEAQLASLEAELARIDNQQAALLAMRGELAAASSTMTSMTASNSREFIAMLWQSNSGTSGQQPLSLLGYCIPDGLIHWNHATLIDLEFNGMVKPMKEQGLAGLFQQQKSLLTQLDDIATHRLLRPDGFFAVLAVPSVSSVSMRLIITETQRRQALLSCSLERFKLREHRYPSALAELGLSSTAVQASDVISGQSMHYLLTPSGRYKLWSQGVDGRDDQGKVTPGEDRYATNHLAKPSYQGDWTWQYEPSQP